MAEEKKDGSAPAPDFGAMRTIAGDAGEPGQASRTLKPGDVFAGRYVVEALIGEGGSGSVYKVKDKTSEEILALKLMRPDRVATPEARKRLVREAVLARAVRHSNVVGVYDVGEAGDQTYVAMEFLPGQSLRSWMRDQLAAGVDCSFGLAAGIVTAALDGLEAAHAKGMVHRDLKPENIFLLAEPKEGDIHIKLLDFGLARRPGDAMSSGGPTGTPLYMAPEQITAPDTVKPSADIYSIGIIFYELLVGVLPTGHWQPPSRGRSDVPAGVDNLIETALSNRPRSRPQSVSDFRASLAAAIKPPAPPPPQSKPAPVQSVDVAKLLAEADALKTMALELIQEGNVDAATLSWEKAYNAYRKASASGDREAQAALETFNKSRLGPVPEKAKPAPPPAPAPTPPRLKPNDIDSGHPVPFRPADLGLPSVFTAKPQPTRSPGDVAIANLHASAAAEQGRVLFNDGKGPASIPKYLEAQRIFVENVKTLSPLAMFEYARFIEHQFINHTPKYLDVVREWTLLAATGGQRGAMTKLGYMLRGGWGGPQNIQQSFDWFTKAAEAGDEEAHIGLGYWHRDQSQFDKSREQFEKGLAKVDNSVAARVLAELYLAGKGGPVNRERAKQLLIKSARSLYEREGKELLQKHFPDVYEKEYKRGWRP